MNFYDRMKSLEKRELLTMLAAHPEDSLTAIAEKYGLSRATLYHRLFKHGISNDQSYFTKDEREKLLKTYEDDLDIAEIERTKMYHDHINYLNQKIDVINMRLEYERNRKWYHKLFNW